VNDGRVPSPVSIDGFSMPANIRQFVLLEHVRSIRTPVYLPT